MDNTQDFGVNRTGAASTNPDLGVQKVIKESPMNNSPLSNAAQIFGSDAVNTAITEASAKSKPATLNVVTDGVRLIQWGPYTHILLAKLEGETGLEQINLDTPDKILGFMSGLFELLWNRDHFSKLDDNVHAYVFEKMSYHAHAGYVAKIVTDRDLGLPVRFWHTVSFDGAAYNVGKAVVPTPYAQTKGWSEEARKANRMRHNIVAKHNGINLALRVMDGTAVVKFSEFALGWQDSKTREGFATKLRIFQGGKAAFDAYRQEWDEMREFSDGFNAIQNVAAKIEKATGAPVVIQETVLAKGAPVMDITGEKVSVSYQEMVSKTFKIIRGGGRPTPIKRHIGNIEAAVSLVAQMAETYGVEAYLEEVVE